jgi:hypothetical protein
MAQNPQKRQVLLQWRGKQSKTNTLQFQFLEMATANMKSHSLVLFLLRTTGIFTVGKGSAGHAQRGIAHPAAHYLTLQSDDYSMAPKGYLQFVYYCGWFWIAVAIF